MYWVYGQKAFPIRGYDCLEVYIELFLLAERFFMPALQDDILTYLHGLLLPETLLQEPTDEQGEEGLSQAECPFADGEDLVDFLQLVWNVTPDSSKLRVFFAKMLAHFCQPGPGSIFSEELLSKLPRSCLIATMNSIADLRVELELRMDDWEDPIFYFCNRYRHESKHLANTFEWVLTNPADKVQHLMDSTDLTWIPVSDPAGLRSFYTRAIANIYENAPEIAVNEDLLGKLPTDCVIAVLLAMIDIRQDLEFCGEEWAENALNKFLNKPAPAQGLQEGSRIKTIEDARERM